MKEGFIPQEQRKKILLLCDDISSLSGVATMAKEIVYGTSHKYNWVNLGAANNHPSVGQRIDLSKHVDSITENEDSSVIVYPYNGYGDASIIRRLLRIEKPDAIMIFTDPRYFEWLFTIENEVRKICPIIYYNIWDSTPAPLWNKKFYESCDSLFGISKQTENINKIVLGDIAGEKLIKYIPHGINSKVFHPIENDELISTTKKHYFEGKKPKFVALFNSRNIRRKSIPDLLMAWKLFCEKIDVEETALLLHTDPIDSNGTDLYAVIEALFGDKHNVYFTKEKLSQEGMNLLYNISDVTILPSSAEGWGLSLTESLMSGTPIIGNVTGGIQDQMRFEDNDGKWIEFDDKFLSNHFGKYEKCGVWANPVFPNNMSIVGSVSTPYIFDDRLDFRDLAKVIKKVYSMDDGQRKYDGLEGRKWVLSDESMMSAENMCKSMIDGIDETIRLFEPKQKFKLIETDYKVKQLTHPIIY